MPVNWDDPELSTGGEFFAFNTLGDEIVGELVSVVFKDDTMRGKKVPDLTIKLDNGDEKIVTAGQYDLLTKVVALRPEPGPGTRIAIKFASTEASGKASPKKIFDVRYRAAGGAAAPAAAPAPAPVAAPVEAPAVADPFADEPPF